MPAVTIDFGTAHGGAVPAGNAGGSNYSWGQQFTPSKDITVTALRILNKFVQPQGTGASLVIYRNSDNAVMTSTNMGSANTVQNAWTEYAVGAVTLTAGVSYTLAYYYGGGNNGVGWAAGSFGSHGHTSGTETLTLNGLVYSTAGNGNGNPYSFNNGQAGELYLGLVGTPVNVAPGAPGAPSVAPNPVNTNGTITWGAAVDPDGDAMTYDVELSTNNGGSWAVIAAGVQSGTVYNFAGQPSTTTAKVRVRAKDSNGAYGPYATMAGNFTISHNVAPTAATALSPDGGTVVDRALVQRLAWTFNDPNAGDTQSKADWRWRVGVGAWTTATVVTPNPYVDVAGGTFPAGTIEWQVLTYDALGVAGVWSASAFFTAASAPAAPAITRPANNSAQAAPTGVLAWSAPTQDAYQVRKVADAAGAPNTAVVYYDTGTVVSTTARDAPLDFPVNNRTEHLQVRIRVAGLWSTWSTVKVNVAYSPPAVPTLVATPQPAVAAIDVAVTNPAPVNPQPVVAATELWRRRVGGTEAVRLIASVVGGVYRDVTPASGVAYEYQAVAIGVTGTKQASAWTP